MPETDPGFSASVPVWLAGMQLSDLKNNKKDTDF